MRVEVRTSADDAAAAAADAVAAAVRSAIDERSRCALAVSGGSTPRRMFEELAKADLPWHAIHLFQVDERLARDASTDRNFTGLKEHLLRHVDVPVTNLHPMPVGMPSLDEAARRYEDSLRAVCGEPPVLDVVHLGLGSDGHTASLFPGDAALDVVDRDVVATAEHHGFRRLTLTVPAINRAGLIVWLVTGSEKADALERLLDAAPADAALPASRIERSDALVFADDAALAEGGAGTP